MKKRILSILLTLCMTLCLTPISVFAEEVGAEGSASVQLGTTALNKNVNTATAPTVYFGQNHDNNPAAWRVIGYDGSGVTSAQGDITLLAAGAMGVIPFADIILYNDYAPSNLKTAIDALAAKLTTEENAAVKKRALTSGSYNGENTDCVAGGQVDNAVFWPLSTAEAFAVNNDLRALDPAHPNWVESSWWLRSPGSKTFYVAIVSSDGSVQYSGISIRKQNNHLTVRPAFNLNLNSVLFTSAAVGGKPDGGLTPIPEYSGNEWKLTLLDSSRNFAVTEKAVSADPNDTITLNYSGATTGANEYISAIIADNNGAQYYGRVAQPTAESGTVEIKIPSDIAPGNYTLKVFSEQYNGDYKTDYASNFTDIALTVEKQVEEQFSLTPGGRYYFDLSAMNIPGTANGGNSDGAVSLPDTSLHYVPFTYVGTIEAYKLTSEMATTEEYAQQNKYPHSLFVADYAVTHTISWGGLNDEGLIFGKNYASGGVDYTLRAPSVGSNSTGSGESQHDTPSNNEWDRILDKNSGYIQNWNKMYSWGQDTSSAAESFRAYRGYNSARFWYYTSSSFRNVYLGFRPVLEVLNPGTLGSDGLKVVTLDLGGGKLGNSSEDIQIIVKTGSEFTAPASDGLTRPDGDAGSFFMWLGSNGKFYAPGDSVPAEVTKLTAQWTAPTYAVTLNTNGGTINSGNVTSYTYGVGATLPTADDMTYTGYMFKGWYDNENLTGSPVTAIGGTETGNKEYWAKWEINQYTITFDTNGGSEIAPITQDYGTAITAPANPTRKGYTFKGWDKEIPKTMPAENITVKAQWEINQYAITFDTNGGSEIAPITQDYGTAITAPADPTRKGYTFKGWDKEIPETMPAENMTVKAQWEINRYTITFDTAGGSEIAPITQDYGTQIAAPANPTRKGYTFKGWDKEIPETMPAENITVTAQWEINRYTITFDTNGGSEIAPITQDYGTQIAAPANPTREGYTFNGWDRDIPEIMPAENITVTAQWEINRYTITFDTAGGSEIAPITQDYGTNITAPADPTREGYTFIGWDKAIPTTMPAENITVTAQWKDSEKPTGEIKINENSWKAFLNNITFGLFFKDTQTVTINAADNSGETVTVEYLLSDKELTKAELDGMTFTAYTAPFGIDPDNEYIIYVRLTDNAGNTDYICSDGIVLDGTSPVITGIENGKTYCEAQIVTVDEKYIDTVQVSGNTVTLDSNNQFTLNPAEGEQTIVVTDKAGNETRVIVTVNDGHTYEWQSENGQYWQKCKFCNHETAKKDIPTINISGADKVCRMQDYKFSFTLPEGATDAAYGYEFIGLGDGPLTPTFEGGMYCGVIKSAAYPAEETSFKLIVSAKTADGFEFSAEKTVAIQNEHSGGTATCTEQATCEICGEKYGDLKPHSYSVKWSTGEASHWHECTECRAKTDEAEHTDTNKDHKCDVCDKVLSECTDTNKDHKCDLCGKALSEHSGGKATCKDKAKCEFCGESYGELNANNHSDLKHFPAVAATKTAEGNIEYWYCSGCKKYYKDATATQEIKQADTVTAKLPGGTVKPGADKSPQTGDNSNLLLWIALLFISGGAAIGTTVVSRKKKYNR